MAEVEIISGTVSSITDGDTFKLDTRQGYEVTIRLIGIDTPERGERFYDEATEKLRQLIDNQKINVTTYGRDQYQRTLGSVTLKGENVSVILVRHGLAKVYRRSGAQYGSIKTDLERNEQLARSEGKGVWSL